MTFKQISVENEYNSIIKAQKSLANLKAISATNAWVIRVGRIIGE